MSRRECSPEQQASCPLRQHFRDVHHKFWPKRAYDAGVDYEFRELDENKVVMCRNDHNELHRYEAPPVKPPEWYMQAKVRLAEQAIAAVESESA